ncbi:hypothetical protein HOLleu_00597 [Holothuria leucospilota]|uniref:Uncharacterized protein n=1 Tax=Holothuria leucospilota TaxID=206669 RepID=A0A9Q1HKF6_HOLLE|nr:hypothetical protein HOLleu_00597 [Holothuria leucospilota]
MENLIPDIPASPVYKDSSDTEETIPKGLKSPRREPEEGKLPAESFERVKYHLNALSKLQKTVIGLKKEITKLDEELAKGNVPNHLRLDRGLPKLPGFLHSSEEVREEFDSLLQRAGLRLGQAWRQELSRQAKKQKDRFLEKEQRARLELETVDDGVEEKKVLWKLLEKSGKRTEERRKHCQQKAAPRRHHPYKR